MNDFTEAAKIWRLYSRGRDHHHRANLYGNTDMAHRFFEGDQWHGLECSGELMPMYNFIQPACEYKIAMVALKSMSLYFSHIGQNEREAIICKALNRMAMSFWEKGKLDKRIWEIVREACIAGDSYLYFFDSGFNNQVIDNTDIYFADEQQKDIQKQRYIIISERRLVCEVKEEARKNKISEDEIMLIVPDDDTSTLPGKEAKNEVKDEAEKCSCLLYLTKKDGNVCFTRSTRTVVYQPETVIEGMTLYPIASFVWLPKKGSARGRGEVSQLIPNQIECNRLLARRVISTKLSAFPKPVYSESAVINPEDIDRVGAKIEVSGGAEKIFDAFGYVQPSPISPDARVLQEELISTTQRMACAGDAALGNVNPERASGAAIVAARDQSAMPLNEQSAALRQFAEDIALIWLDMICAYNPHMLALSNQGETYFISTDDIRKMQPDIRVDVSPADPYSRYAREQYLMELLKSGQIEFEEFVLSLDDQGAVPKGTLEEILRMRGEKMYEQALQMQNKAFNIQDQAGGFYPGDNLQMPVM